MESWIARNHGARSASPKAMPRLILSMFEAEWKLSASTNIQPRDWASNFPTVVLPEPSTPIMSTTKGLLPSRQVGQPLRVDSRPLVGRVSESSDLGKGEAVWSRTHMRGSRPVQTPRSVGYIICELGAPTGIAPSLLRPLLALGISRRTLYFASFRDAFEQILPQGLASNCTV